MIPYPMWSMPIIMHAMSFNTLHDRCKSDKKGILFLVFISNDFNTSGRIMKQVKTPAYLMIIMSVLILTGCDKTESASYKASEAAISGAAP